MLNVNIFGKRISGKQFMNSEKAEKSNTSKVDEGRTKTRYNWRGDWIVNSCDRWKNLKVIHNRHHIRESYIKPDKLTYHLITIYMGAPSRQQSLLSGRNYNILQTAGMLRYFPKRLLCSRGMTKLNRTIFICISNRHLSNPWRKARR